MKTKTSICHWIYVSWCLYKAFTFCMNALFLSISRILMNNVISFSSLNLLWYNFISFYLCVCGILRLFWEKSFYFNLLEIFKKSYFFIIYRLLSNKLFSNFSQKLLERHSKIFDNFSKFFKWISQLKLLVTETNKILNET